MVNILLVFIRKIIPVKDYITKTHFNNINKLVLFSASLLLIIYINEIFNTWINNNPFEQFNLLHKAIGSAWWIYFLSVFLTILLPQLFWIKKYRINTKLSLIISVFVLIGMWLERFIIVVVSSEQSQRNSRRT